MNKHCKNCGATHAVEYLSTRGMCDDCEEDFYVEGLDRHVQRDRQTWLGRETIWGQVDNVYPIAEGLVFVSTPSHGGYIVSEDRYNQMPDYLRACSFTSDRNFEEDCSWAAVVCAWPDLFDSGTLTAAIGVLKGMYPQAYKRYRKEVLGIAD